MPMIFESTSKNAFFKKLFENKINTALKKYTISFKFCMLEYQYLSCQ